MAATDLNIENVLNALREQPDLQIAIMESTTGYTVSLTTKYTSPFREDNSPACFFKWENGLLKFKDFAAHFSLSGTVLDALRLSANMSMSDVLKYVNIKYNLCLGYDPDLDVSAPMILPISKYVPQLPVSAVIRYESLCRASAFDYFYEYGITHELLTKYSVKACKTVWVQSSKGIIETFNWQNNCPLFLYCWRDGDGKLLDKFKMYRPLASKTSKWRCNTSLIDDVGNTSNVVDFITSSRKDRMVLELAGYTSVCGINEVAKIDTTYYKAKYTFMDNDRAGIDAAAKYNLPALFVPEYKDPSGYVKVYGVEALKTLIKEQTNNKINAQKQT